MNLFGDAIAWILDPAQYSGSYSLPVLLGQQLFYTFVSVLIAALIAVPVGWLIGHTGRGREVAVAVAGAARAIPSFGLFILVILVIGVTRKPEAAIVTFVVLAIPVLLAGAYAGVEAIDRRTVDAARAVGMTEWQILWRVEVPLGLPLLVGGIRSAVLQVVATVTIAGYTDIGGLGYRIIQGIDTRRLDQVIGAALIVVLLALVLDAVFALLQRASVPRGIRAGAVPQESRRRRVPAPA